MWIRIVKPSPEMCHALLNLACQCTVCSCELNKMNGLGVTGHGTSWQRLMLAVHETVNKHLKGFSEPFLLSPTALDLNTEVGTRAKMLESLYESVMKEDNESAREKRAARSMRMIATMTNTMENDQKTADRDETLACVVAMFEKWEGRASTIIEGETGKEGQ